MASWSNGLGSSRSSCSCHSACKVPTRRRRSQGQGFKGRRSQQPGCTPVQPNNRLSRRRVAQGTVKYFNADKGYGFIAPNDGTAESSCATPPSRLTVIVASRTTSGWSTPPLAAPRARRPSRSARSDDRPHGAGWLHGPPLLACPVIPSKKPSSGRAASAVSCGYAVPDAAPDPGGQRSRRPRSIAPRKVPPRRCKLALPPRPGSRPSLSAHATADRGLSRGVRTTGATEAGLLCSCGQALRYLRRHRAGLPRAAAWVQHPS